MLNEVPNYGARKKEAIDILCKEFKKNNHIESELYSTLDVKRGMRNADGRTGALLLAVQKEITASFVKTTTK